MNTTLRYLFRALITSAVLLLAACGSSSKPATSAANRSTSGHQSGPGALSAEATSAATGDIPDTQNFLTFKDSAAGYSIRYPEGWAQTGGGGDVTFKDKNNVIHVVVAAGGVPTAASVAADLARLKASTPTLSAGSAQPVQLKAGPAIKVTYTTESAPNPVTGKRVELTVDRYVVARAGKRATLDLGTPVGVDNVDAYRMMIQSFKWR